MQHATEAHLANDDGYERKRCTVCCFLARTQDPAAWDALFPPSEPLARRRAEDILQRLTHTAAGSARLYDTDGGFRLALAQANIELAALHAQAVSEWVESRCGLILSQAQRTAAWRDYGCWTHRYTVTDDGNDLRGTAVATTMLSACHRGSVCIPHWGARHGAVEFEHTLAAEAERERGSGGDAVGRATLLWRRTRGLRPLIIFAASRTLPPSGDRVAVYQHRRFWNVFAIAASNDEAAILETGDTAFNLIIDNHAHGALLAVRTEPAARAPARTIAARRGAAIRQRSQSLSGAPLAKFGSVRAARSATGM